MKHALFSSRVSHWLLVVLLLVLASGRGYAQAPGWQTAATAAGNVTVAATTPATDGSGFYLVGSFSGSATFGSTVLTTTNTREMFVAKWNPATSSFAWAIQGTSTGNGQSTAASVSATGTIGLSVVGSFTGTTWQLGTPAAVTNAQAGTSDLFVARLYDNGTSVGVSWTRRAGGTGNDYANAVNYNNTSIIYVGGSTSSNATFGTYTLAAAGGFVAAYATSSSGVLFSQPVQLGSSVTALAYANTNIYATGTFNSTAATFVDASHTLTSAGGEDVFVARLAGSSTLAYGWAQRAGGTGLDQPQALLISGTNVYVAGRFTGTAAFGSTTLATSGSGALFVAKLTDTSTLGSFAWALQSGNGTTSSPSSGAYALASYGTSIYLAGFFSGSDAFGGTTLTSAGASDVLVAKLTDNGGSAAFAWAQQAGGTGSDGATGLLRVGTQLYVTGQVATPASFGSLSIGAVAGTNPGFVASFTDPAPLLNLVAPNIGLVGTTTTLYGTGLAGATAITFAGTSGNVVTSGFTVNAAGTQITGIVVPSGAQTGPVNVTTPLGTSNGLVNYTVLTSANPAPAWQNATTATVASTIRYAQPDASGNVLVTGNFSGSITLGSTTLTSAGFTDVFIAKWNPTTGSYVWAQRLGGTGYDSVYGLAVQGSSVYVDGTFDGPTATFGSITLTSPQSGTGEGYVAKLTDAGSSASFGWAQLLDDASYVFVEALTVSGTSVYVGGDYTGTTFTLGSGTVTGNASGGDGFVAKFTDNGPTASFNWVKTMGTVNGGTINVYGLVARGGTVYLSGVMYGTVAFGSYTLTSIGGNSTTLGSDDVAVARLADLGTSANFTAALSIGGAGSDFLLGMVGQGNALYLAGSSTSATWAGTSAAGAGLNDAFVAKVTDTGTSLALSWVQLLGGPGTDQAFQVAVNGTNVYVAGYFVGTANFSGTTRISSGGSDAFIARLTDAGSSASLAWVQTAGGLAGDGFNAVALSNGRLFAGGSVTPNTAFGSLVITSPVATSVAVLATLGDPAILAAAPAAAAGSLHLYPNPAHGLATVQLPTDASSLALLDALGRTMRQQPVAAGAKEATLNLEGLPVGVYLVRVLGGSGPATTYRLLLE